MNINLNDYEKLSDFLSKIQNCARKFFFIQLFKLTTNAEPTYDNIKPFNVYYDCKTNNYQFIRII